MAENAVIDLRDRTNPPPDDPVKAPYGWRWDTKAREWQVKRSAGGRKAGSAWFGKNTEPEAETTDVLAESAAPDGDPAPAWASKPAPRPRKASAPKVNAKVKGDMSAAVGMMLMVTGPALMSKDPYCGSAVMENAQKITDAVVPLMCRSHTVVAFFSDTTENGWMLWFNLALALSPVAMAVGRHHILRTVELATDEATGEIYAVQRDMSEYPAA